MFQSSKEWGGGGGGREGKGICREMRAAEGSTSSTAAVEQQQRGGEAAQAEKRILQGSALQCNLITFQVELWKRGFCNTINSSSTERDISPSLSFSLRQ